MSDKDYLEGVRAAQEFYNCVHFAWVSKPIKPEDAVKFFLPGVEEMKIEMVMPLPKPRQQWLEGFKEEQENILRELKEDVTSF